MRMEVQNTPLDGAFVVKHEVFEDHRGFFMEVFREDLFGKAGLPTRYVQLNHSRSVKDVVRGLHFQYEPMMAKLMRVSVGAAFLVAADIRKDSPTFGKWYGIEASAENKLQLYAPPGCARGFCVLTDVAEIQYFCTGVYNFSGESGIRWNDNQIGIKWPVKEPILSKKDAQAQTLEEWIKKPESDLFSIRQVIQ